MSTRLYMLVIVATMALQCWFAAAFDIAGAKLDLMPIVVVYAALNGSWTQTLLVATVSGLMLDTLSLAPFGLSVPPLVAGAVAINHFQRILFRDNALVQCILSGGMSAAVSLWTWLLLRAGVAPLPATVDVWVKMLIISGMTASVAPALFWVLAWFRRERRDEPLKVETF